MISTLSIILRYREGRYYHLHINRGGGAVGKSVDQASGRLGVRIPAATDLSHKNR